MHTNTKQIKSILHVGLHLTIKCMQADSLIYIYDYPCRKNAQIDTYVIWSDMFPLDHKL